jgi:GTP cyclohydrolase I
MIEQGSGAPRIVNTARIEELARELLIAIGEDPDREGLKDTPRRYASWWKEFIEHDCGNATTFFEPITTDQMVVVSGMRVWSICEHHLLPFWSDVTIGYIAEERVLGLSKFARIAHRHAHRLQIQERMVHQIADEIAELAQTKNVSVMARGEHLCMSMRGIKTPATMTTSVLRGIFRYSSDARMEFLTVVFDGAGRGTRVR